MNSCSGGTSFTAHLAALSIPAVAQLDALVLAPTVKFVSGTPEPSPVF